MLEAIVQGILSQAGIAVLVLMFTSLGEAILLIWLIKSHREDWKEARSEDRLTMTALTHVITELRLDAARSRRDQ